MFAKLVEIKMGRCEGANYSYYWSLICLPLTVIEAPMAADFGNGRMCDTTSIVSCNVPMPTDVRLAVSYLERSCISKISLILISYPNIKKIIAALSW